MGKLIKETRDGLFQICEGLAMIAVPHYSQQTKRKKLREIRRDRIRCGGFELDKENLRKDFENASAQQV